MELDEFVYVKLEDAPEQVRRIAPRVSLVQANLVAEWAAGVAEATQCNDRQAFEAAVNQFYKSFEMHGGEWQEREAEPVTTTTARAEVSIGEILERKGIKIREPGRAIDIFSIQHQQPAEEAGRRVRTAKAKKIKAVISGLEAQIADLKDVLKWAEYMDGNTVTAPNIYGEPVTNEQAEQEAEMPYKSMDEVPVALKGIKPPVDLGQANLIVGWADEMEGQEDGPESPWGVAIAQFKKAFKAEGGKWVKKKEEEEEPEAEEASQDEALKAKEARSKKYGIALVEGKPVTKPGEYAAIPDSEFGDPVNYAYPADKAHAQAARNYFNHANARSAGGYSESDWATVGKRLAKLVSRHLDADYEYKDGELQRKESKESGVQEGYGELQDFVGRVWAALGARFCPGEMSSGVWITDAPGDDPVWDNAVVAEIDGARYSIGYKETAAGFTFADRSDWQEVEMTYSSAGTEKDERPQKEEVNEDMDEKEQETAEEQEEAAEVELCESIAGAVSLAEAEAAVGDPLTMRVQLIKPGWGNKKDNHYYPAEMLKRDARVFVGAKMFETDHKPSETNNRTWVSFVRDIVGFTDAGAPIAEVIVHSPDFAQRVRNLAAEKDKDGKSLLEYLECSIRAAGRTKPYEVDGRKGHAVEAITSAKSVDWVTKAGAGGKALEIMESDAEPEPEQEQEPKPTYLAKETVAELLEASKMPKAAQTKLAEGNYLDEEAVKAAVKAERVYLQEITGAGKPVGMGKTEPPKVDLAEIEKRKDEVNAKYLGTRRAER